MPSGEQRGEDPEPGAQGASELWRQYCRSGRIRVSRENEHFPALLAEAFEVLSALDYNLAETAKYFETSATQLVRFFASYTPALTKLNEHLVARGRSPRAAN
jgi:hypothetical protein